MVAQGAAWVIIKNDKFYGEKLATPTPTPEPTATPRITPSPTPTPGEGGSDVKSTPTPKPTKAPDKPNKNENEMALSELKDVIGIPEIALEYGGYAMYESYTFDSFSIEATDDTKQLMLIQVIVKNESARTVNVNLAKLFLDHKLDAGGKGYIAKRTILMNDFTTLDVTIDGGGRYESILVFEVEKDFKPDTMNLFITKDKKVVIVKLK